MKSKSVPYISIYNSRKERGLCVICGRKLTDKERSYFQCRYCTNTIISLPSMKGGISYGD